MSNNFQVNIQKEDLIFLPLGGAGEIGMNCNLYHYLDKWLMIDLGVTFNDERVESADLVMPDINFIIERKSKLKGLICTHAHEDHIGAIPYLYDKLGNIPIFTTPFTASVLRRKFRNDHSLDIKILNYKEKFDIGPFNIEIIKLTHSIPEPNAVLIRTKPANVFHTGDWKLDENPLVGEAINEEKIKEIQKEGIHMMICDSTNVFNVEESGSELDVRNCFKKIFEKKKTGKIIVTCFASNIARLETIGKIANEFDRTCVLLGRSLKRIYESAIENNYLCNLPKFLDEKEGRKIPDENIVLVCTGSQGEKRAALYKLVTDANNNFLINKNDLVIFSSREIPGNEKKIISIKDLLLKKNCNYIDETSEKVHVSGHPSKSELKKMYEWVKPDTLVPVHGEFQHLKEHSEFAIKSGIESSIIIENGDLLKIKKEKNETKIIDKIKTDRQVLIGNRVLPIGKKIFSNLRLINSEGYISVVLILNSKDDLVVNPIISAPSILSEEDKIDNDNIVFAIKKLSIEIIKSGFDENIANDEIRKKIKQFFKKNFGIKPITEVKLVRI